MDRQNTRQPATEFFEQTSFLYGGNATYIENLHARYEQDPASVDGEWRRFFGAMGDEAVSIRKSAEGASWKRANWPLPVNGELTSALDGQLARGRKDRRREAEGKASADAGLRKRMFNAQPAIPCGR